MGPKGWVDRRKPEITLKSCRQRTDTRSRPVVIAHTGSIGARAGVALPPHASPFRALAQCSERLPLTPLVRCSSARGFDVGLRDLGSERSGDKDVVSGAGLGESSDQCADLVVEAQRGLGSEARAVDPPV